MRFQVLASLLTAATLACGPAAAQIGAAPAVQAPPSLTGVTAGEYVELGERAAAASRASDWEGAARIYRQTAEANPNDGEAFSNLGRALMRLSRPSEAAQAFAHAHRLGTSRYPETLSSQAAIAFAQAGDAEEAMDWIEIALNVDRADQATRLLAHRSFAELADRPRFEAFSRRYQPLDSSADRTAKWEADLDLILAELDRAQPDLKASTRDEVLNAAGVLRSSLGRLSDFEIIIELQRLATLLGTGHTGTNFFYGVNEVYGQASPVLPLSLWWFPDGLYVWATDSGHEALVGARVDAIGGVAANEALQRLSGLVPRDNDALFWFSAPQLIVHGPILKALGLAPTPTSAQLTLLLSDGRQLEVTMEAGPRNERRRFSTKRPAPAPLYFQRTDEIFWDTVLPDRSVYIQLNRTLNAADQTLDAYGRDLGRRLHDNTSATDVILDLRHNTGGNTFFYGQLLRALVAFDTRPDTVLYVITSRSTGSAAANLVVELERLTDAVIVGEPNGNPPRTPGDPVEFLLPNSRIDFAIASTVWALTAPKDTRPWVVPDFPAPLLATDYFANRDPAMDLISANIAADRGPPPPA